MEISFGDTQFRSQKGQAVTEYLLVLLVAVAIIMGGVYQLNDAFRVWAENYFGNYVACLLETGELPSIGGTPGDSGLCNEIFEPFSLANGRKLKPIGPTGSAANGGGGDGGKGINEANEVRGGRPVYQSASGGRFGSRWSSSSGGPKVNRFKDNRDKANGSGSESSGFSSYSSVSSQTVPTKTSERITLDNNSLMEKESEQKSRRRAITPPKGAGGLQMKKANRIPYKAPTVRTPLPEDEPFTFAHFIRILLIAAILIALLMVLGGQLYSASKSMER